MSRIEIQHGFMRHGLAALRPMAVDYVAIVEQTIH